MYMIIIRVYDKNWVLAIFCFRDLIEIGCIAYLRKIMVLRNGFDSFF